MTEIHSPAPTAAPTSLTSFVMDSTSIFVSWQPPPVQYHNGIIRMYTVRVTEIETSAVLFVSSQNISTVITSLHPNYHYTISVAAVTVLPGPFSSSIMLQTPQDGEINMVKYGNS